MRRHDSEDSDSYSEDFASASDREAPSHTGVVTYGVYEEDAELVVYHNDTLTNDTGLVAYGVVVDSDASV